MPYQITGTLKLPDGTPASNVDIEFISQQNYSPLVRDLSNVIRTGSDGRYSINLEYGEYAVRLIYGNANPLYPGKLFVFADTPAGQDLPSLMQSANFIPATPEYIVKIQGWLLEAAAHEAASAVSEANAKASELAAKSSELAVEADRLEVASNKDIAVSAQADVTAKAAQASLDAASALVSKNTAVAAADTASQKAESAAAHDASAQDAATRAEQAANVVVGALLDAGPYDASTGVLPAPIMGGTIKRSSIWKVTVDGVAGGISLGVGDSLVYTSSDDSYYKIDNTESVSSVNGETGVVVLTATKVGADAAGTAAVLLSQHASQAGAHQISGVSGLSDALAGKEQTGVAASLVQQHAVQAGAHQISGVLGLQSALDGKYSPSNKPSAEEIGAEAVGAVSAHASRAGAHPISGVDGLRQELDDLAGVSGGIQALDVRLTAVEGKVSALEQRKSTCLVNAIGTGAPHETVVAALPANIEVNTRYVLSNPFGSNTPVDCWAELFIDGKWSKVGWIYDSSGGWGADACYVQGEGLVLQTGSYRLAWDSSKSGGGHGWTGGTLTLAKCRIFVRKLEA